MSRILRCGTVKHLEEDPDARGALHECSQAVLPSSLCQHSKALKPCIEQFAHNTEAALFYMLPGRHILLHVLLGDLGSPGVKRGPD